MIWGQVILSRKCVNLFSFINKRKGFPLDDAIETLSAVQSLSEPEFYRYQDEFKWKIFHHHIKNNSWYRHMVGTDMLSDWSDIPVLTKSDVQRPIKGMLSDGYSDQNVYLNNTSGSTGQPFHFAKDKFSHAMTWAYIISSYKKLGLDYGRSLQARFFGIPLSAGKFIKEQIKDILSARERFPVFDLSDCQLEKYLKRFHEREFQYIYGYTSSLVLFGKFLLSRGLKLCEICPTLRFCIVTSEVCSDDDRELLRRAFGIKVVNEYGAAELDIIAFEDKDGDWLLNEENLYIEVIGADGKPVKDEQEGSVVVTSLYNKAMPFIRYNLGDIISVWGERKGVHRRIKTMQGRTNDVAILPSGKKAPGLTFYYVSKSLLEGGGFLKEFTIKQLELDHFHFEYISEGELTGDQKRKVSAMMDLYLEPNLRATFERVDRIERSGSGKFKHFQNLIAKS